MVYIIKSIQKGGSMTENNRANEQAVTRRGDNRDHVDDAAVLAALQSLDRAVERIVRETQPQQIRLSQPKLRILA